jgi:hypothetical protein
LVGTFPFPTSQIVSLRAIFNFTQNTGVTFSCNDYRINSLYQFDIVGATSTDFSGTTQLAAIYESYHVERISVKFELNSIDAAQPIGYGLVFKDTQPSTLITTRAHAINSLEVTPTTGPHVVGVATGMSVFRSRVYTIDIGRVLGNPISYQSDIDYTSSFGAFNPAQALWMGGVAYSVGGVASTSGVEVMLTVDLRVRVYSIRVLEE